MKSTILSLAILLSGLMVSAQQTANVTTVITVKIPDAVNLNVAAGGTVDFDFVSDVSLLTTGIEKLNAVSLSYSSNKPWFLSVSATNANFTGGNGANPMPVSVVQIKNNAGGTYAPLSSTTPIALSGTTGSKNAKGASTVNVDYKLTPGLDYPPATDYSISLTYTISTI